MLDAAVIGRPLLGVALRDGGQIACVRAFDGEPERGIHVQRVRVSDYAQQSGGAAAAWRTWSPLARSSLRVCRDRFALRRGHRATEVARRRRPRPTGHRLLSLRPLGFKAIESERGRPQRTGREFQFESDTRQATIDALAA